MCGITGRLNYDPNDRVDARVLTAMTDAVRHRGPDASGYFVDGAIGLGHRRLSIIDLSTGDQPLGNEDGRIQVVFNGEIYNFAELRETLQSRGHRFRTGSDTEVIVHGYEEWGDACVERFRGMFAFAVWDAPAHRLLLARDRLGIKPLYWARAGRQLIFGSEIKAILASGLVEAAANEAALPATLSRRYTSGRHPVCRHVHNPLPGPRRVSGGGSVGIAPSWAPPLDRPAHAPRNGRDVVAEFRSRLDESVRLRLMSDVPVGMFLS